MGMNLYCQTHGAFLSGCKCVSARNIIVEGCPSPELHKDLPVQNITEFRSFFNGLKDVFKHIL